MRNFIIKFKTKQDQSYSSLLQYIWLQINFLILLKEIVTVNQNKMYYFNIKLHQIDDL